jgi:predicted phage terminase large subunit-like protein
MRFEESQKCTTSIGFVDPRTQEGELLWPAYKNEEEVARQEKDMGGAESAVVAAQLQQRPAPAKGLIFEKDWFQHWDELPARFDIVIDSWDCTFKDTDRSDYVVGQRWGRVGAKYFLIARRRGRWSFPKTLAEMKAFLERSGLPKPHAVLVEDKANGPAVMATLGKEVAGFVAINPEGGKVVRAQAITPLYEARNVWHPNPKLEVEGVRVNAWVEDHESELMKFPKGKNDDSVDAETQALHYLRNKATQFAAAMDRLAKEGTGWLA